MRKILAYKVLSLLSIALLLFGSLYAQTDSQTETSNSKLQTFPPDIDSLKLDSFFTKKNINYRNSPNQELYFEVFRWYNTCYRYGGNSEKGIDCSHFVNMLYEKIYGKKLQSSSSSIYTQCEPLKAGIRHAEEGDLLFFKIRKKSISHIALYLQNGKFAHASTKVGVIISDMDEPYYKKHFYKAGKIGD
ncbi:MAG: C40 family peptidase [Bacteroidetes bacterium]|nr:C40 family peptidase [Bacteroidota bacterium]